MMKYKTGQKVKIKTWEELKKEKLLIDKHRKDCKTYVTSEFEILLQKLNRVVTIKREYTLDGIYSIIERDSYRESLRKPHGLPWG